MVAIFLDRSLCPPTNCKEIPFERPFRSSVLAILESVLQEFKKIFDETCLLSVNFSSVSSAPSWGWTGQWQCRVGRPCPRGGRRPSLWLLPHTFTPPSPSLSWPARTAQRWLVFAVGLQRTSTGQVPKRSAPAECPLVCFPGTPWSEALPLVRSLLRWCFPLIAPSLPGESFFFELNLVRPSEGWVRPLDTADVSILWPWIIKTIIKSVFPD